MSERIKSRLRDRPLRVFVVTGAPRTGTHMLNSILCGSPLFHPLLTEAVMIVHLLDMRQRMLRQLKIGPDNYFSSPDEVDELAAQHLDSFLAHLYRRFRTPYVVLRTPMLSRQLGDLQAIASRSRSRFDFVVLVRDPRDILCSLKTSNEKRIAANGQPIDDNIVEYAVKTVRQSYAFLKDGKHPNVHLYKYEEIVSDLPRFIQTFAHDLDISPTGLGKDVSWTKRLADLSPANPNLGPWITDLYLGRVSGASVGRFRTELSQSEIATIERGTHNIMRRFGYQIVPTPD